MWNNRVELTNYIANDIFGSEIFWWSVSQKFCCGFACLRKFRPPKCIQMNFSSTKMYSTSQIPENIISRLCFLNWDREVVASECMNCERTFLVILICKWDSKWMSELKCSTNFRAKLTLALIWPNPSDSFWKLMKIDSNFIALNDSIQVEVQINNKSSRRINSFH